MKKKAAIVITRMDLGGAQQIALETARGLDPLAWEVLLVSGPGGMLDPAAMSALGPRFIRLNTLKHPISPLDDLRALLGLAWLFHRERVDLVHTHSSKAGLLGRLAGFAAGVPALVHTVHGWSFHDEMGALSRAAYILMERLLAPLTSRYAAVAESVRDKGLLNRIGRPGQYQVLRAAVDLEAWRKAPRSRAALAEALGGLAEDDLVVGCLANCKPQKNPLDFVRVAALVLTRAPKARFVYLGDGPLRPEAEALALKLGVADRVRFLGWVGDPLALAAGFDLFLLTSLWEGLPCVFPQVLSLGIPVVAYQVDGAPEIVTEGVNGHLVAPGDLEGAAERLLALARDPGRRARFSAAARAGVGGEYALPDMVGRTQVLYDSLMRD